MTIRPRLSLLLPSLMLVPLLGCGDDATPVDLGVELGMDGGVDMAMPIDEGVDEGVEAGPEMQVDEGVDEGMDEGVEMEMAVDMGTPCEGPPDLYSDANCEVISEGIRAFEPAVWLWTDGIDKQRYIRLPEGERINTEDPDNWIYPVGTQAWKTFSLDGVRLETRYFEKIRDTPGLDGWAMRTFAWNEEQDAVEELTVGRDNVLGTNHDIPSFSMCVQCHAATSRADVLNSFTAIQLNHPDTDFDLAELNDDDWLTDPIPLEDAQYPGNDMTSEALGYLHANCGNCHGNRSAPSGLRFWVNVGTARVMETDTFTTAVGVDSFRVDGDATVRIVPGNADDSVVIRRMSSRDIILQMPPIGTEIVHDEGVDLIRDWINSLRPLPPE
ncbi:MAG: hypothetical protein AAF645_21590 [Myxococcota bacterium]